MGPQGGLRNVLNMFFQPNFHSFPLRGSYPGFHVKPVNQGLAQAESLMGTRVTEALKGSSTAQAGAGSARRAWRTEDLGACLGRRVAREKTEEVGWG